MVAGPSLFNFGSHSHLFRELLATQALRIPICARCKEMGVGVASLLPIQVASLAGGSRSKGELS